MKALKITLIVVGSIVLFFGLVVGGATWWFVKNKDRLKSIGKSTDAAAQQYADGHTQDDCVAESFRRSGACDGFACAVEVPLFNEKCLALATPSPDLCNGVPSARDVVASVTWMTKSCVGGDAKTFMMKSINPIAAGDQSCQRVLQSLANYCTRHPVSLPVTE